MGEWQYYLCPMKFQDRYSVMPGLPGRNWCCGVGWPCHHSCNSSLLGLEFVCFLKHLRNLERRKPIRKCDQLFVKGIHSLETSLAQLTPAPVCRNTTTEFVAVLSMSLFGRSPKEKTCLQIAPDSLCDQLLAGQGEDSHCGFPSWDLLVSAYKSTLTLQHGWASSNSFLIHSLSFERCCYHSFASLGWASSTQPRLRSSAGVHGPRGSIEAVSLN